MHDIIRSGERGYADHGWLKSYHTFSFADYYDPRRMGVSNLRVINDDRIAPGTGFGAHAHRDMEIVTYVLEGAITHRDSTGSEGVIRAGEVQRMSAGSGIVHSEFNEQSGQTTHMLQIWILPEHPGIAPGYEQRSFGPAMLDGKVRPIAAPDGRDGALRIHANASLFAGHFNGNQSAALTLDAQRTAYIHAARGSVQINGIELHEGDGLLLKDEPALRISNGREAEILLFDLI